jgi:hypothetical protein
MHVPQTFVIIIMPTDLVLQDACRDGCISLSRYTMLMPSDDEASNLWY